MTSMDRALVAYNNNDPNLADGFLHNVDASLWKEEDYRRLRIDVSQMGVDIEFKRANNLLEEKLPQAALAALKRVEYFANTEGIVTPPNDQMINLTADLYGLAMQNDKINATDATQRLEIGLAQYFMMMYAVHDTMGKVEKPSDIDGLIAEVKISLPADLPDYQSEKDGFLQYKRMMDVVDATEGATHPYDVPGLVEKVKSGKV